MMSSNATQATQPRDRVLTALAHQEPDRVPVDLLATPEVWDKLITHFKPDVSEIDAGGFFEPEREAILQQLEVDCRLISYDMFCAPPDHVMKQGATVDWWDSLARSTPNRMWRQQMPDATQYDMWGHHVHVVENPSGSYEEFASYPLQKAATTEELSQFSWPEPDWWDLTALPKAIEKTNPHQTLHLRFRAGSVFETAWQLRGMEEFLMDLAADPQMPEYIMDRLTEILVEVTRRVLETAGDQIDMVYFYDDVGAQNSLLISKNMWRKFVRPRHEKIIAVAKSFGKPVMYHCDGAIYPLISELIDLGIDVLNPLQPTAKDMAPARLKEEFGDRLTFHGGIDIVETLPHGSTEEVVAEVKDRVKVMGEGGGYILASSHHIQADTPLENVLAMYQTDLRYRR